VWRLTAGLEHELGIANQLRETSGADLAAVLQTVDALSRCPPRHARSDATPPAVALLDYHNRPHYVRPPGRPPAPSISTRCCAISFGPAGRLLYQQSILHDALECHSPAAPQLIELVTHMQDHAKRCLSRGERIAFPARILSDSQQVIICRKPAWTGTSYFRPATRGPEDRPRLDRRRRRRSRTGGRGRPEMKPPELPVPRDPRIDQWLQVVEEAAANRHADIEAATTATTGARSGASRDPAIATHRATDFASQTKPCASEASQVDHWPPKSDDGRVKPPDARRGARTA